MRENTTEPFGKMCSQKQLQNTLVFWGLSHTLKVHETTEKLSLFHFQALGQVICCLFECYCYPERKLKLLLRFSWHFVVFYCSTNHGHPDSNGNKQIRIITFTRSITPGTKVSLPCNQIPLLRIMNFPM